MKNFSIQGMRADLEEQQKVLAREDSSGSAQGGKAGSEVARQAKQTYCLETLWRSLQVCHYKLLFLLATPELIPRVCVFYPSYSIPGLGD